jgi:hypothetical protein
VLNAGIVVDQTALSVPTHTCSAPVLTSMAELSSNHVITHLNRFTENILQAWWRRVGFRKLLALNTAPQLGNRLAILALGHSYHMSGVRANLNKCPKSRVVKSRVGPHFFVSGHFSLYAAKAMQLLTSF